MFEGVLNVSSINYITTIDNKKHNRFYKVVKRGFDITISLIGLMFLIPIILLVKIIYVLNKDFDSIILTQDRIGKNGELFKFYKFRTMIPNADEYLFKYLKDNKEAKKEYELNKKLHNDPRITKAGKVLRKLSIDELPQLFNILKGDMSLIGNRPYLPREKEDMYFYFNDIVKTKPGLTGYWQVSGRSNVSFNKRLQLESYYSKHYSAIMDIKIFFKTFKVVLFGRDAK